MNDSTTYPKLRWPVDIRLERVQSQEVLILLCPLGVSKAPLALTPAIAPVISCFEGNLSFQEILNRFSNQGLTEEILRQLIELLDQHLFLATPRFFAAQKQMHDEFSSASVREAALAGLSYSDSKAKLETEIDTYFANGKTVLKARTDSMCGVMAPHIDYRRGSMCYGITYNHLKQEEHNLYILIGTSHQYSRHMFHLSAKDFNTPLGKLSCDREFVNKLAEEYGKDRSFADEILHKKEHSLELQTPFLKRLKVNPTIVPILVGSFHHIIHAAKAPEQFEEYDRFASSLTNCVRSFIKQGKKLCVVAGVDMAHVGKAFGDPSNLTPSSMEKIAERDQAYLQTLIKQDKKALFAHIAEDNDARRICGFPTMYTVLDLFDRLGVQYSAELFDYRQAVDYQSDCAVTFAGMGLYAKSSAWTLKQ